MKWLRRQFRSFEQLLKWWYFRFTPAGKAVTLVGLACVPYLTDLSSPLFLLFSTLTGLLTATFIAGRMYRPRAQVRINVRETVEADCPFEIKANIFDSKRSGFEQCQVELKGVATDWRVTKESTRVSAELGGDRVEIRWRCQAPKRGRYACPAVQITSTYPFNLFRFEQVVQSPNNIWVTPKILPLHQLRLVTQGEALALQLQGSASHVGQTMDFVGNREYRPELPTRRFNYAKWAQLSRPVVREYAAPSVTTFALILDASRVSGARDSSEVSDDSIEAMVSLAASLSEEIAKTNGHVLIMSTGDRLLDLSLGTPAKSRGRILRELATAEPGASIDQTQWLATVQGMRHSPQVILHLSVCHSKQATTLVKKAFPKATSYQRVLVDSDGFWRRHPQQEPEKRSGDKIADRKGKTA